MPPFHGKRIKRRPNNFSKKSSTHLNPTVTLWNNIMATMEMLMFCFCVHLASCQPELANCIQAPENSISNNYGVRYSSSCI